MSLAILARLDKIETRLDVIEARMAKREAERDVVFEEMRELGREREAQPPVIRKHRGWPKGKRRRPVVESADA